MSREFGIMSYKPESINFTYNTSRHHTQDGEPMNSTGRLLGKNLLLAAYRTPSAADELAIELGVALPYVEDELRNLERLTLMRKNGNKYETNFFIISAAAQAKMYDHIKSVAQEFTERVTKYLDAEEGFRNANGYWHEGGQTPEDMRWARLMDFVSFGVYGEVAWKRRGSRKGGEKTGRIVGKSGHTVRPNGGEWDVIGYEISKTDFESIGCHGMGLDELDGTKLLQYKFYNRVNTPYTLSQTQAEALVAAARENLSGVSRDTLRELTDFGYLREDGGGGFLPTFRVTFKDKLPPFTSEQRAELDRLLSLAADVAEEHCDYCDGVIRDEVPAFLKNDSELIAQAIVNMLLIDIRGAALVETLKSGWLTWDPNRDNRALGMFLEL
jgi:hypothetical protein